MREAIWIGLCLFASIGIAQCATWLAGLRVQAWSGRGGYYLVPLFDDPAAVEAQLHHTLGLLAWNRTGIQIVLLVDMGLGEECLAICERFIREKPSLLLCKSDSVAQVIRSIPFS